MEKISIEELTQVVARLVHAAKIDDHYSEGEKKNCFRLYIWISRF